MGHDGYLLNPSETPYVDVRCYVCARPVTSRPDLQHARCVGEDGRLPIMVEYDFEFEER